MIESVNREGCDGGCVWWERCLSGVQGSSMHGLVSVQGSSMHGLRWLRVDAAEALLVEVVIAAITVETQVCQPTPHRMTTVTVLPRPTPFHAMLFHVPLQVP